MIKLKNVSKRYSNGCVALDNVSLELAPGEFAFLTGHSGAGKSTLLKMIAAIEPVNQGEITVANQSLANLSAKRLPFLRRQMGLVLQRDYLLLDKPVFDNVALPLIVSGGCSYKEINNRVRAILTKIGLVNKAQCYPSTLSSGERQCVVIARALVTKPPLLLADEPMENLDPTLAGGMMELFEQFNRLGMTIFITSHDPTIQDSKHKLFMLSQGKIIHASTAA